MLGNNFYFSLIRKYTTIVGTLFNDLIIDRDSTQDDQKIKVPLYYAPKEKVLARFLQDPNINREFSVVLPMISFEMVDVKYDVLRKINPIDKISLKDELDAKKKKYQFNRVPYDFSFVVSIYVKNTEDGTKILEQILPYFSPDITLTADLIPELGIPFDLPIVLNGVQMEDKYDGDFKERKMFVWTLSLTLKGYVFGPIKSNSIIKFTNTNIYNATNFRYIEDSIGNIGKLTNYYAQPGLTANNTSTTNSNNSISPLLINIDDDWGFCFKENEFK